MAGPLGRGKDLRIIGKSTSAKITVGGGFESLFQGNTHFRQTKRQEIKKLATEGQHPEFLFLGCADSRVSEGTIFNADPGTLFAERSIANLYQPKRDLTTKAILAYGVNHLKVKHIIVMGHYGCGGVGAAIASPPKAPWDESTKAIQRWIMPIRRVYAESTRPEIVALRNANKGKSVVPSPKLQDPGFRALVEENIKNTVKNVANDEIIKQHFSNPSLGEIYVHGWVYDIENGEIRDIGVSVGPPGKAIPQAPFPAVAKLAAKM
ncbi:carbonic anhydrase [Coprinopsis marcescibilis]|uniref:Carbonic anhydrase n=1 Tax=Coprinopsis marcescibilis TaxID=230819 RepID=A0A5C3LCG4_COPMA|nr:carbonic anhydrase [Coprinopsis marcescibilis]